MMYEDDLHDADGDVHIYDKYDGHIYGHDDDEDEVDEGDEDDDHDHDQEVYMHMSSSMSWLKTKNQLFHREKVVFSSF